MGYNPGLGGIAIAVAFVSVGPNAVAQDNSIKYACQNLGSFKQEPLGDRDGHSISVAQYSCRANSGPMIGGVMTGTNIWEWDKTTAVLVSGSGVVRKPGGMLVFTDTEGRLTLTMTDGKVTGYTASGRIHWPIATGTAASLAGKSASWAVTPTGPDQFEIVDKVE